MDEEEPATHGRRSRTSGNGLTSADSLKWKRLWHVQGAEGRWSWNLCMKGGGGQM